MPRSTNANKLSPKDKQAIVQSLWNAVNEGGHWLEQLPHIVTTVIETECWKNREVDGKPVEHKRFIDFVVTPPRAGCGWPPEKVEALLADDPVAQTLWRDAVTGKKGAHSDNVTMRDGRGNSRAYTLSRLKRERPDLFAKVVTKEMSANAAATKAGWRKKPEFTCPHCGHKFTK